MASTAETAPGPRTPGSLIALETNKGTLELELFDQDTPITAGSFLLLVKQGFYDGLNFHRLVPGFVIQGGDPQGDGSGGPGFRLPLEVSPTLRHDRGVVAMARSAMRDSAGSQFYICLGGPDAVGHLDDDYAVFGRVVQGMDIVDQLGVGDVMVKVTVTQLSPSGAAAEKAAEAGRLPVATP